MLITMIFVTVSIAVFLAVYALCTVRNENRADRKFNKIMRTRINDIAMY